MEAMKLAGVCITTWLLLALLPANAAAAAKNITVSISRFDCGMRSLALRYAQKVHSWRDPNDDIFTYVHDALRLTELCGKPRRHFPMEGNAATSRKLPTAAEKPSFCEKQHCVFVSPHINSGTRFLGKATGSFLQHSTSNLHEALSLSRSIGDASHTTIILQGGIHELSSTLRLDARDSGLRVQGYPGEEVWISGGLLIPESIGWKKLSKDSNVFVADISKLLVDRQLPKVASVFTTTIPHRRLIRARFPNSDPELALWGFASPDRLQYSIPAQVVTDWHRPPKGQQPSFTLVDFASNPPEGVPTKTDSTMDGYNTYASGSGGVCADLWGPEADSYWCSNASAGGWAEVDKQCAVTGQLQIPAGMTYNQTDDIGKRMDGWGTSAEGAFVFAWHSQSWSMHMFEIDKFQKNGTFRFLPGGGKQGGRNWCRCDQCTYAGGWCGQHQDPPNNTDQRLISGTWLVENVLKELDQPGEFYFDHSSNLLYVIPNMTSTPGDLRFALHERLIELMNVTNVSISDVGFRDAAPTFMSDWSAPSGGDWALHRGGAVFMENVSDISISGCLFRRLDGSAIFLSRRTRNVTIDSNVFEWLGENAVATWGDTNGFDATDFKFPLDTIVRNNVMRELGIYQKQSSAVGQAKTARSLIHNNLMFNMPRAAINFNDGMGGGDVVQDNLIFNTCRESGDHGPINSWDRQAYLTTMRDGSTKSFDPLIREISNNYIIANYGASQAVDNDDGSSWFYIHDNLFHDADGLKMDYGGHDSVFEDNLVIGNQCVGVGSFKPGHGHVYRRNKCIVGLTGSETVEVAFIEQCGDGNMRMFRDNYFTVNGTALFRCGEDNAEHSLHDVQSNYGIEAHSTSKTIPADDVILKWAKDKIL